MLNVTPRMELLADAGGRCRYAADIGTDHAYLAMHLVRTGRAERVYAVDNKSGPLSRARDNVASEGMSDSVECILADGFDGLAALRDDVFPDTVFIAGIGGIATGEIVARGIDTARRCKRLILQPANREEDLRRVLYGLRMHIRSERVIEEDGRYFVVFDAAPGEYRDYPSDGRSAAIGEFIPECGDDVTEAYLSRKARYIREALMELRQAENAGDAAGALEQRLRWVTETLARIKLNKTE